MEKNNKDNKAPVKPKMRIQLLDENLITLSDRLVDQAIELYQGPKDKHKNPIKLEVVLTSQNDINAFKEYIDQLAGNLPIREVNSKGRPASTTQKELESPREDILLRVEDMIANGEDQDAIINYLRKLGFVFMVTEDFLHYFPGFPLQVRDIGQPNNNGQYPESLNWMVRRTKMGKMPSSDKYDPMIIFGFKVMGLRNKKFVSYLYRDNRKKHKAEIPTKKALSFANFEMSKMPHYMTEDERLKWSAEMRSLMLSKDKKPSKFFLRWAPEITLPNSHKEKLEHLNITFK